MSEQSAGLDAQLAKLRRGLADRWLRVSDVFSRWDDDNSGTISKSEWVKVVVSLIGADQTNKQEAAALFDALDKDRSGELDYKELYKELRAGGSIELDSKLKVGGGGPLQASVKGKFALRKDGPQTTKSRVLYGMPQLEMGEGTDFAEQLSNALVGSWTRVRDLWAEWDDDLSGKVDPREFYQALTLLGLRPSRAESDELFKRFDADGSGTIEFDELKSALHRTGSVEIDAVLRAGAVAFDREAKNRFATRKNGPGKTGSNVLNGLVLKSGGGVGDVMAQLRAALSANLGRVIDLFREWDADSSGSVDKKEFQKALQTLGMPCSAEDAGKFFDTLDDDRSGALEFGELHAKLKRGESTSKALVSGVLPRFYRGPVTTRDVLLQILPRLGLKLIDALGETAASDAAAETAAADDADGGGDASTIAAGGFVRAVQSIAAELALAANSSSTSHGMVLPYGKRLAEELRAIFQELLENCADAQESSGQGGGGRLPVSRVLPVMRALRKAEEACAGSSYAQRVAAMAADQPKIIAAPSVMRLRVLLSAQSKTAIKLLESWDVDGSGEIGRETFQTLLPALHISATKIEADALYDTLAESASAAAAKGGAGKDETMSIETMSIGDFGRMCAAGLCGGHVRVKPSKPSSRGAVGGNKTPRPSPTLKASYVSGMIEHLGSAYFLAPTESAPASSPLRISPRVHAPPRPSPRDAAQQQQAPAEGGAHAVVVDDGEVTDGDEKTPVGGSPRAQKLSKAAKRKRSKQQQSEVHHLVSLPLSVMKTRHVDALGGVTRFPEISPRPRGDLLNMMPKYSSREVSPDGSPRPRKPTVPAPPLPFYAVPAAHKAKKLPPSPRKIRVRVATTSSTQLHIPASVTQELNAAEQVLRQKEEMAKALERIKQLELLVQKAESAQPPSEHHEEERPRVLDVSDR